MYRLGNYFDEMVGNIVRLTKKYFYSFIFITIYKIILDYVYVSFIYKVFGYSGFSLDFSPVKFLISIFYFILVYLVLPKDADKPSSIFLQLHFIIMIIPMLTYYSFTNDAGIFMLLNIIFFSMQCIVLRVIPNVKIAKIKGSQKALKWIIVPISFFVYISMIRANGMPSLKALNVLNVYDIRRHVKYPFLMGYLVNWQAKIINPFLITIFYAEKNKKMIIVPTFMQLFIYLITGHKSFLFIPLAILIVIKIIEHKDFFLISTFMAAVGTLGVYLLYVIFDILLVGSIFIRRFLFLPAKIKFDYYDFFSKNEFLYFSQGILGKIIGKKSLYQINAANLIGYLYYGNVDTNANTGYLADAYANMGVLGMLLITILLIIIFMFIDSFSISINKETVIGLSLFSILSLNNGALLTSLLTGGLLLLLVILYLYSSDENVSGKIKK